jgi:Zn-dependent protease
MNGFRIGKIFNINIQIDWSWLLILGLVTWSLAASFGQLHPQWTTSMQWGMALLAAFLFFLSVLAHELAHSLVAQAQGVPVRNITLFLFGGVSNIQKEPTSPVNELLVTIVGPLTSFILGGIFLALGAGSIVLSRISATSFNNLLSQINPLNTIFLWLGSVNILLGVFNLIPGFPLDGGRILRSILWGLTDNLKRATRWASWIGQGVAWLLIISGLSMLFGFQIPFLGGGFINGIWLIFIGWFLQTAAVQSYRRVVIQDILEDIPVKKIMNTNVPTTPPDISVEEFVDHYLMQSDDRAFIVYDHENMIGLITIEDVRKLPTESRRNKLVRDVMTPSEEMIVVAPDEDVTDAFDRLQTKDIRQLPVVTGNKVVGLLRRKDIIRWLQFQSHTS